MNELDLVHVPARKTKPASRGALFGRSSEFQHEHLQPFEQQFIRQGQIRQEFS
jgi:hypothetical protein